MSDMQEQLQELSQLRSEIKSEMTAMETRIEEAIRKGNAALSEQITKATNHKATASYCCPWS